MNTFKKYPKDWLKVLAAVLIGFFAVMGWHFTDVANTPFWWKFWPVLAVICLVAWVGAWIYLSKKDRER